MTSTTLYGYHINGDGIMLSKRYTETTQRGCHIWDVEIGVIGVESKI